MAVIGVERIKVNFRISFMHHCAHNSCGGDIVWSLKALAVYCLSRQAYIASVLKFRAT